MDTLSYMIQNSSQIITLLIEHIRLTSIAVGLSVLIGVPIGILISYAPALKKTILGITNLIQAIPSLALLGFSIPLMGIGTLPAVIVVFLYSLLPIVKNTYTGITQIKPELIEAARGIGMTRFQILKKVRIPFTLPLLMAGIRISAVTAVGLMTISAFIGAGGLGFLIFSGISSVNTDMILAGAIPACILALVLDWFLSLIEDLVTPISLQVGGITNRASMLQSRRYKKSIVFVTVGILFVSVLGNIYTASVKNDNIIRIGSKQFSEQLILGNIFKELIEKNTDLAVEDHLGAGSTQILFSAMRNDDLDLYIDYTGTIFVDILKHDPVSDSQLVYETSKNELNQKYDITLLNSMLFNNTFTLAMTKTDAEKYNINKMSDLSRVGHYLISGTTFEFLNRKDGLAGIEQAYNFKFNNSLGMDGANRYVALENNQVQVIDAFSTDGLLKKFDLLKLVDDKAFFPPYYGVPLIRSDVLKQHPELEDLLNSVSDKLTNEEMQNLNYQVDVEGKSPVAVAHEFLVTHALIKG